MFVDIDKNFVLGAHGLAPDIGLVKRHEIECSHWQAVATESEQLGIEEIAVDTFNPAGLAADVPWGSDMARAILELYFNPVARFEFSFN
jgi:hypothetical protein